MNNFVKIAVYFFVMSSQAAKPQKIAILSKKFC